MRLRQRLLLIFLGLGVIPILAVGWMAHRRTLAAIRELVASQAQERADRLAGEIEALYQPRRSEFLYFAENSETLRLLHGEPGGADPREHLRKAWGALGGSLEGLEIVSSDGVALVRLGRPLLDSTLEDAEGPSIPRTGSGVLVVVAVRDPGSGRTLGEVLVTLAPAVAFPSLSGTEGFGRFGEVFIVDRESRRILSHPSRGLVDRPLDAALGVGHTEGIVFRRPDPGATFEFARGDSLYLGVLAEVPRSPWAVVSLASVPEFSAGIAQMGRRTLGLVVVIASLALAVGMAAIGRALGRLDALTEAAGDIAEGDFSPDLPRSGGDEVGTLARAFRVMVGEIQKMLVRVEESRQLAAVGEFASQVAHEIRNPLTAIRVNLQALRRDLRGSPLAERHGRPLDITIGEVDRLDRVTRGVLNLAQSPMNDPVPLSLHAEVRAALAILQPDLEKMEVVAHTRSDAQQDGVYGNSPALRGAILNLIRNAAEAMPQGGTVHLCTEVVGQGSGARIRLHVRDEGSGVSEAVRERVFDPFVTTKEEGTGLGLSVALRAVEAHGGSLRLVDAPPPGAEEPGAALSRAEPAEPAPTGAHFIMDLPLLGPERTHPHPFQKAEE